ncbi:MAG: hypothetical protein P1Q69_18825, partial [Candidatus Thorarchaeota archaeon]|nr:hypothetical protein [Candidatus Thorarchaeota archaeon]
GTFCLSTTHVEIEENSDRDGTDYYDDNYNDPDSEWGLMLKISIWQVESSTYVPPPTTTESATETTNTTTPEDDDWSSFLPVIAVSGVIAVVLIVGVIFKQR